MSIFKKIRAKSIINGVLDSIPVVSTVKANIEAKQAGTGQMDYQRLIVNISAVAVILAYAYSKVKGVEIFSFDELKELLKLLVR
jgi:hypothetical protein